MVTKNIKKFLLEFKFNELSNRGILKGKLLLLQGKSVEPLIDLMRECGVERVEYPDANWFLDTEGKFMNPYSPEQKEGEINELSKLSSVFKRTNPILNPHYHGGTEQETEEAEELLECLKSFNSKERFFLVGEILGNPSFTPTNSYINKLSEKLNLNIGPIEFSAMDYHLDWIYACLAHTSEPNTKIFNNSAKVIRGQQEDVDFIVGYQENENTHLILIEAKATNSWTNKQLKSKAERLEKIFGFDGKKWDNVIPHFIITSPIEPSKITYDNWPTWMKVNDSVAWLELEIPSHLQSVTRCDANGSVTSEGNFWKIQNR